MTRRRDDFSPATKRTIERLAGHVCSICRASTVGANADGSGLITTGTAAHICAAAEGGPRYDPKMSSDERRSVANGIWLCRDHGDAIDDDSKFYTIERLRHLKRQAEIASWRRVLRKAPPPEVAGAPEGVSLREAARADLAVFRNMPKWPKSTVALTLKVDGIDEGASTFGLASAAQAIDDLVLVAPPGMGKTTTLLQIAEGVLASEHGVPIFVALADWATDGRSIFASILARSAWRALSEDDLRSIAVTGDLVLLLDGWNELEPAARERARVELERLKAETPELGLVVSTRRQALDLPFRGTSIELLPLNDAQQLAIAEALKGDEGTELLDRAWRTPHVRDLVSIPLYLTALMSLPSGTTFPETREEVLRRFVEAHEADPRRAERLRTGASGFQLPFLDDLALVATCAGNTAISDSDARRSVTRTARALAKDDQIATLPDPGTVLGALVDNHVLVRAGDTPGIAFQHQQFQEWFASHGVERQMAAALSDHEARGVLQRDMLDQPFWEEAILFAIERMARGQSDAQAAAGHAIRAAFEVDPLLAAEMIHRANDGVWTLVAETIVAQVTRWHKRGTSDRALRFMMDSGRAEFLEFVWPLITHDDDQVSLKALRNCRHFHTPLLGNDAGPRIQSLAIGQRKTLLHEIAMHGGIDGLDLAVTVARFDPEVEVQVTVADALTFRQADRHLTILLQQGSDALFDSVARPGYPLPEISDPKIRKRLAAARKRTRSSKNSPIDRLRAIMHDDPDSAREADIEKLVARLTFDERSDSASRTLHQLHQTYPNAVAAGLLARLRAGKPLFYGADDLLAGSGYALEEKALLKLALAPGERDSLAKAAASVLGPISTGHLIDELIPVSARLHDRSQPYDKTVSDRYHGLIARLTLVPTASLIAAAQARSDSTDSAHVVLLAKLLARHRGDGSERSRPCDEAGLAAIRALAQDWGNRLLAAPDASRHDVAEVANLIAQVPEADLLPLLKRMLDDNLRQYSAFRAEAAASGWREGKARDEASWPATHAYRHAFLAIDAPETRALMRDYLTHPHFGEQAAQIIVSQWVRANEPPPEQAFGIRHDFAHVRERRAQRLLDPSISDADAEAIFSVVETLIDEGSTVEQQRLGVSLACHAARLPHGDRPTTIERLLSLAHRRVRPDLIASLVQSGEVVPTGVVAAGIEETFEAAKSQSWILYQSDAYELTDWLQLLPFTDDLSAMIDVVRAIPVEHRPPRRLEKLIGGLAETPSSGTEVALFALAELEPKLYSNHSWYRAAFALRSESAVHKLVSLTADGTSKGWSSSMGGWQWTRDLALMIKEFPEVRRQVYERLRSAEAKKGVFKLAQAIAEFPDEDGLLLLLDLEHAWGRQFVSFNTIQELVTEQVPAPAWVNAYSIVPIAAASLRKRLLASTTDGGPQDLWARALTAIDVIRDEHGRAMEEPRHPDLTSLRPWPILTPDPDATAD